MPTETPDAKSSGSARVDHKKSDGAKSVVKWERDLSAEESRRFGKWYSFAKTKLSFGFQHLAPEVVPAMADDRTGFAIRFDKIAGWSIPAGILRSAAVVGEDVNKYEYQIQLSLSMYHLTSCSFFGSTWMGSPVTLNNNIFNITETTKSVPIEPPTVRDSTNKPNGFYDHASVPAESKTIEDIAPKTKTIVTRTIVSRVVEVEYQDIIYMISRIIDPTCVAVIEVVLTKISKESKLVVGQYG
jgi:hypothetical protein